MPVQTVCKAQSFFLKMFTTGEERCTVSIFKEFLWHHPLQLHTTDQLYLSCVQNPSLQVWYKQQSMGVNKINGMMKSICKGLSLEDSSETFFNHSIRKTVVKKLKTVGLELSTIVKIIGHRNLKSLDDYDEGDELEQRQLSLTISNTNNNSNQLSQGSGSTPVNSSSLSAQCSNNFVPFNRVGFVPWNFQMPCCISGQND